MIPRRPRYTPFPYTTLFRSDDAGRLIDQVLRDIVWDINNLTQDLGGFLQPLFIVAVFGESERGENGCEHEQDDAASKDRKSTRLNSSHLVISYAVFCLKKKT